MSRMGTNGGQNDVGERCTGWPPQVPGGLWIDLSDSNEIFHWKGITAVQVDWKGAQFQSTEWPSSFGQRWILKAFWAQGEEKVSTLKAVLPKDNASYTTIDNESEPLTTRYCEIEGQRHKAGQWYICYIEEREESIGLEGCYLRHSRVQY